MKGGEGGKGGRKLRLKVKAGKRESKMQALVSEESQRVVKTSHKDVRTPPHTPHPTPGSGAVTLVSIQG